MPGKRRVRGDEALLFLGDIRDRLTLVALDEQEYPGGGSFPPRLSWRRSGISVWDFAPGPSQGLLGIIPPRTNMPTEHRTEITLNENGVLSLSGLPFRAGETVEVIVHSKNAEHTDGPTALKGMVQRYDHPFDPVAAEDWDALRDRP